MTAGLLLTALGLGFRHGVDWDHVAAIADLSTTADDRRRGMWLSLLYALGHAAVVLVLGLVALELGLSIPESADSWMGLVVGATLIALGGWVIVDLIRKGRDFRLRSRWVLILGGTFRGVRRVISRRGIRVVEVEHTHSHQHGVGGDHLPHAAAGAHDHAHLSAGPDTEVRATGALQPIGARSGVAGGDAGPEELGVAGDDAIGAGDGRTRHHRHEHRHRLVLPDRPGAGYGPGTAVGVGVLHGVGIESPTQIAIFVASTSVVGRGAGIGLLCAWIVGLVAANSVLAAAAATGVMSAERNFTVYATLAVLVAAASIAVGVLAIMA